MTLSLGLVAGRHAMPVDNYVLASVADVMDIQSISKAVDESLRSYGLQSGDVLNLYVTGLTSVTLAVTSWCVHHGVYLTAWHFNRETGDYISQKVL